MVPKSDMFNATALNPQWSLLGYTSSATYSLEVREDWLYLEPYGGSNTVIQNDGEHSYSLITRVDFEPQSENDEAGLWIINGPESHYVTVIVQRPDGYPPSSFTTLPCDVMDICFSSRNEVRSGFDMAVKLFTADGETLVDETSVGAGYGYGLLRLNNSPWDTYPVPAMIRVFLKDMQVGPDHVIESSGVEGLYPDDVYTISLN